MHMLRAMGLEPQIVYLAQPGATMTVAISGTRLLIRHTGSATEQLKEYPSEDAAAQGFAAALQDLAKRRWALDPEQTPNPEPLDPETVLELEPPEDKNWNRLTKIKATDEQIPGALRINGRKADALEPDDMPDVAARIGADERTTLHLVEGGGEALFSIGAARIESIETVIVDTLYIGKTRQCGLELGDISYALSELPGLKAALIVGALDAVKFESQSLEQLHVLSSPLHVSVVTALAEGELPNLHTLSLGLTAGEVIETDIATEDALLELISSDALPGLRHLSIERFSDPDRLLTHIVNSPRLAQLETIHIPDEFEDDDAVTTLLNEKTAELANKSLEIDMIAELFPKLKIAEPTSRFSPNDYVLRLTGQERQIPEPVKK